MAALYAKNNPTNPVLTYAIGLAFQAGDPAIAVLNNMATQGHTGTARFANSQAHIQAAFGDIAASAVKYEVCNGADDNCNGAYRRGAGLLPGVRARVGRTATPVASPARPAANCSAGFTARAIAGTKFCVPGCDTSSQPQRGSASASRPA